MNEPILHAPIHNAFPGRRTPQQRSARIPIKTANGTMASTCSAVDTAPIYMADHSIDVIAQERMSLRRRLSMQLSHVSLAPCRAKRSDHELRSTHAVGSAGGSTTGWTGRPREKSHIDARMLREAMGRCSARESETTYQKVSRARTAPSFRMEEKSTLVWWEHSCASVRT